MKNAQGLALFLVLVSIVVLASFLRIENLSSNPPGFYTDEASIGYNAYKILTTGRDEHGKLFPVFFEAFGEYKSPFAVYSTVPAIAIFGLNEFAVRVTQAIWGILDVIVIFFLGWELFGKKGGILAAFVMAISPWHVHISRFNIESHNAFLFFVCGGFLFTLLCLRKNWQIRYMILCAIFWALSFYTYFATRIFTPLFLICLFFIFMPEIIAFTRKEWGKLVLPAFIFFLILSPFIFHVISGKAFLRFEQVGFNRQNQQIDVTKKSRELYIEHFEPKFVFFLGDSDFPGQNLVRHSVTGIGLMYKWQLPLFLIGFGYLLIFKDKKWGFKLRSVLVLMLLLYPLGSVVSDAKTPYATRSVIGVIPYSLIIALGILASIHFLRRLKPIVLGVLGLAVFSFAFIFLSSFFLIRFENLSKTYMNVASGYNGFQYGTKDVVNYFLANQDKYDLLILYSGLDGADAYIKFFSLGKCGKCYSSDPKELDMSLKKLMAVSVDETMNFDQKYAGNLVKKIYYPNGREAFRIYDSRTKQRQ